MLKRGFTITEVILIVVILAILAGLVTIGFAATRRDASQVVVQSSIRHGSEVLETHFTRQHDYPPNFAGTEFVPTDKVSMALYTNAPQVRRHTNLTPEQNAQLFLNSCNANMPVMDGSTTYNTNCSFAGNNIHIKGQRGSNIVLHGPTINESDFTLTCGSACNAAQTSIKAVFVDQGGSWPLTVPSRQVTLPEPELFTVGKATRYCLEARHEVYEDLISHIRNGDAVPIEGQCPTDSELHYP